jgi:hypothetical protein
MDQVKLERLLIQDVSGVDDPANQLPGWLVTKARGAGLPEAILRDVASGDILADPAEVEKARHSLRDDRGKFRQVVPRDLAHGGTITDEHGVTHHLHGMHPKLRAILTGKPRATST